MLTELIYVWVAAYMIYHLNPMNDISNPHSKMHYYHPENCIGRVKLQEMIDREIEEKGKTTGIVLHWPTIWPYMVSSIAALCYVVVRLLF